MTHTILRVEPATPFTLQQVNGTIRAVPVPAWRSACRCGHLTRTRTSRAHAISDGVRHCMTGQEAA